MPLSREQLAALPGVALTAVICVAAWSYRPLDVTIGRESGRALLDGDFAVYAHHPDAQMGPLALVLCGALPRPLYVALVCTLLGVFLAIAHRAGAAAHQVVAGGLLLALPWAHLAVTGHVDDVLVLLGAAAVVVGFRAHHQWSIIAGFVLAMAGKPTAVLLVGLLALAGWRVLVAGLAAASGLWAPFVLADPGGFLAAGHGIALVQPWSGPFMLGAPVYGPFPDWVRPVQLVASVALCYLVGRFRTPAAGVLAAVVVRVALEPGAWPSYCTTVIAAGLLLPGRWRLLAACSGAATWVVSTTYPLSPAGGLIRMGLLLAVAGLSLVAADDRVSPHGIDRSRGGRQAEPVVAAALADRRPPDGDLHVEVVSAPGP